MGLRELNFAETMEFQKIVEKHEDDNYTIRNDDIWIETAKELKAVRQRLLALKDLQEKEKELKEQLIFLSMQKNSKGGGLKLRKLSRQGSVEISLIPELWGIDLNQYRKPSTEYWQVIDDA